MKTRKVISFLTAAAMAAAFLPILSASAEGSTYALGDVDMDGVITGHDAAMVSRMLHVDSDLLTEEQKVLADVNEDGVIDQTDADWIHENEVFGIGDILKTGKDKGSVDAAWIALTCYSRVSVDNPVEIVKRDIPKSYPELAGSHLIYGGEKDRFTEEEIAEFESQGLYVMYLDKEQDPDLWNILHWGMEGGEQDTISELDYHLIDVNGDGTLDADDAYCSLVAYAKMSVGAEDPFVSEGRYDLY